LGLAGFQDRYRPGQLAIPAALLVELEMKREPQESLNVPEAGVRRSVHPQSTFRKVSVDHYARCLPG
jgi:hypothetical protein